MTTALKQNYRTENDFFEFEDGLFPSLITNDKGLETVEETKKWIEDNKEHFVTLSETTGAVLFRGFPIIDGKDFDAFIRAFGLGNFTYEESLSNAVRTNITELVFTANEAPPEVDIFLHHEMAQTPLYPSKLFFFCETAPSISGGATPLCRSDVMLEILEQEMPEMVQAFEEKGVTYTNIMPSEADLASGQGRSWKSTLKAEDKQAAEKKLKDLGYSWEWMEDGSLKAMTPILPAVRTLSNGKRTFFNQLIAAYRGWKDARNDPSKAVRFGDGSEIDKDFMARAIEVSDALSFDTPWQSGDVALVDNFLVMHGRRAFEGKRRVLASLVA